MVATADLHEQVAIEELTSTDVSNIIETRTELEFSGVIRSQLSAAKTV